MTFSWHKLFCIATHSKCVCKIQNQVSFQSFNEAIIIFVTIKTPKKIPRTNNSTKKEWKKKKQWNLEYKNSKRGRENIIQIILFWKQSCDTVNDDSKQYLFSFSGTKIDKLIHSVVSMTRSMCFQVSRCFFFFFFQFSLVVGWKPGEITVYYRGQGRKARNWRRRTTRISLFPTGLFHIRETCARKREEERPYAAMDASASCFATICSRTIPDAAAISHNERQCCPDSRRNVPDS